MLIHFISSKSNIIEDIEYFRSIIATIHKLGHELSRDWVEPAYEFAINRKKVENLDWKKINQENMEALSKADIVIAEATTKSFSTGFQTALAIQQKRPTLILTRNHSLRGSFGSGISSDLVRSTNYTKDNIAEIISKFVEENTIDVKDMRFNFFIDRQIYNYLRWTSSSTGKTKAEILRDLVLKEIKKED